MKQYLYFIFLFLSVLATAQTSVNLQVFDAKTNKNIYTVKVIIPGFTDEHIITKTADSWKLELPVAGNEQDYVFIFQKEGYYDSLLTYSVFAEIENLDLQIKMRPIKTSTSSSETFIQGFVKATDYQLLQNVEVLIKLSSKDSLKTKTDKDGYYYFKIKNNKIPSGTKKFSLVFRPPTVRHEKESAEITKSSSVKDYHLNITLAKRNTIAEIKGKAIKPDDFIYAVKVTLANDTMPIDETQLDEAGNFIFKFDTVDYDPAANYHLLFYADDLNDTIVSFNPRRGIQGLITLHERPLWDRTLHGLIFDISLLPGTKDISYYAGYIYFSGGRRSQISVGAGLGYAHLIGKPIETYPEINKSNYDSAAVGISLRSIYFGGDVRYYYRPYSLKKPVFNPTAQAAIYFGPDVRAKLLQPKLAAGTFINITEKFAALVEAQLTFNFYSEPQFNYGGDFTGYERAFILKPFFNVQLNYIIPIE
ncbi:MAG: hypothetical protein H7Y00_04790 [Fimbriimonadaceae bacterium]|nr:hypothetical protein [Chitinophagales bacterium]